MKEIFNDDFKKPISFHKKIRQIDDEFKTIITNEEKINSKNNLLDKDILKRKDSKNASTIVDLTTPQPKFIRR